MRVRPAFGSLTGVRDQGFVLKEFPSEQPAADYLGVGNRAEEAKAKADEVRVAGLPPTRMIIESLVRC